MCDYEGFYEDKNNSNDGNFEVNLVSSGGLIWGLDNPQGAATPLFFPLLPIFHTLDDAMITIGNMDSQWNRCNLFIDSFIIIMATIAYTIFSIFTRLEIWQIDLWQFRTLVLPGNGKTLNRANLSWGQNSAGRLSVKRIGLWSRFSTILTLLLSSNITAISYFKIWENWPKKSPSSLSLPSSYHMSKNTGRNKSFIFL